MTEKDYESRKSKKRKHQTESRNKRRMKLQEVTTLVTKNFKEKPKRFV